MLAGADSVLDGAPLDVDEALVVVAATPDLVTLKFWLWAMMPWFKTSVPTKLIWNLSPGVATRLEKEYFLSEVLTFFLISVCLAPEEEEWSTRTMVKFLGSVSTAVHSMVLDWERSHCASRAGAVMVMAGEEVSEKYGGGRMEAGSGCTLSSRQEAGEGDEGFGEHFESRTWE